MAIAENPYEAQDAKPREGQTHAEAFLAAYHKPSEDPAVRVTAVAHEYGYMVLSNGCRLMFEQPKCSGTKRNEKGRCTRDEMRWPDGSGVLFRWSEANGGGYTKLKK